MLGVGCFPDHPPPMGPKHPMPVIKITPSTEHPVPFDLSDDVPLTFEDELAVSSATAELQVELGALPEVDPDTYKREQDLLDAVIKNRDKKPLQSLNTAYAASAFLKTYAQAKALDVAAARSAITHKLLEIANCGDTKYELRALELLGKHSDIGLFTERSEITINYKSPEALEDAIKERVKRLLNAEVIDITPLTKDLDEELGVFDPSSLLHPQDLSHYPPPEAALKEEDEGGGEKEEDEPTA